MNEIRGLTQTSRVNTTKDRKRNEHVKVSNWVSKLEKEKVVA